MEKFLSNNLYKAILILILCLGFCLRFYQLGQVPAALNRDEPAIGYNAFSILKIGKDEWGKSYPLVFKSFGDYKSPLYIYLTTISIKLFGLNEFSVRFIGALAGTLTLLFVYLLVKKLVGKSSKLVSLCCVAVLAIMPWHIFFSRFSYEAILALLFNVIILYFFVGNEFSDINLKIAGFLVLSFMAYASSIIIWPIYLFIWLIYYLQANIKKIFNRKTVKIVTIFAILAIVLFQQSSISNQKSRVTVLSDPQIRLDYNRFRTEHFQANPLITKIFYNQYIYYGKIILINYFKSFSWNFLFGGGGQHPWHKTIYSPHFYPIFSILIIIGLLAFLTDNRLKKINKIFLIIFSLISIVSSAITLDAPHATRLLNFFLVLCIFSGFGISWLIQRARFFGFLSIVILFLSSSQFVYHYFIDYKNYPPEALLPGIKEAIKTTQDLKDSADRIVFGSFNDGSYIYLLFYTAYNPETFLKTIKRYPPDTVGLEWAEYFDKYLFVDRPELNNNEKQIFILKNSRLIGTNEITKITNKLNNQVYYQIAENF